MKNVLCKVYAAFFPVGNIGLDALESAAEGALGNEEAWLFLEEGMLKISFEGVYFPLREVMEALEDLLPVNAEGKLDYLDLEEWRLHRHIYANGAFTVSERSLNHVLDYAGH